MRCVQIAGLPHARTNTIPCTGAQAASATGATRASAHDAVRRAEEHLQAAKALAADTYEAAKGKTHETYLAGPGPAQAALKEAEALAKAAREKVLLFAFCRVCTRCLQLLSRVSILAWLRGSHAATVTKVYFYFELCNNHRCLNEVYAADLYCVAPPRN